MESFISRYKNPLVLAIVLGAQLLLLAVQVKRPFPAATAAVDQAGVQALRLGMTTVVAPPESALHSTGKGVRGIWDSYLDLIGVQKENQQLRDEVNQLRLEQAALAEDARQGQRLQDLLAFRQHYVDATVPAQIIGSSGNDRARIVYIDKGSDDGLAADMPVITPDGIVGKVREVYPRTSQVIEISDPASASGVLLEDTRTRGIVRGISSGEPAITSVMPDDRIKPGMKVLTSGGDGIFPRGLPVGTVARIVPDHDNAPMVDVVLKPAANLSRLEEVLVVTGTASAPTEKQKRNLAKSEAMAAAAFKAQVAAADKAAQKKADDEAQRASDVLAARLPSREEANPDAPDAAADASPMTSEADARPLHPLNPVHPDHYSPQSIPGAAGLTPGERYAPLAQGNGKEYAQSKAPGATGSQTDAAPSSVNPAFAAAASAADAERKAAADSRAAEAAKRYDALHPKPPAPSSNVASVNSDGVMHWATHKNDDGTTARTAVPGAAADGSGFRFMTRENADGTSSRVAVPVPPAVMHYVVRTNADGTTGRVSVPGLAADGSGFRIVDRPNADGTTAHLVVPIAPASTGAAHPPASAPAAPASASAPEILHWVTRTSADGTTTRVALKGPAADGSGFRYESRLRADGTSARVAVPVSAGTAAPPKPAAAAAAAAPRPAGSTAAAAAPKPATTVAAPGAPSEVLHFVNRTNADGTTSRVALAGPGPDGSGFRYVTRTNPDGTTARVAVPVAAGSGAKASPSTGVMHYTTRTNPDGTTSRVAVAGAAADGSGVRFVSRTNADGTTSRIAVPVGAGTRAPAASNAAPAGTHYVTRVNADGTTTRVAVQNAPGQSPVKTTVINDGPVRSTPRPANPAGPQGAR
jgi:rod shape-determining protein MreC